MSGFHKSPVAVVSVVVLWVMVNLVTVNASDRACPLKNCTAIEQDDRLVYNCTYAGCREFPFDDDLDIDVGVIDLSHNDLTDLPQLPTYKYLTSLNLAYNKIRSVHEDAFVDCRNLITVNLTGNKLASINGDAFDFFTNLEYIYLDNNQLRKLNDTALFFYTNKLKVIELQNNLIDFIGPDVFYHFGHIETIRLSNNSLASLDRNILLGLWYLKYLFLDNNKLGSLSGEAFATQKDLLVLDLRHNLLKEIGNGTLDQLKSLEVLHLSYNPLNRISEKTFTECERLQDLYLEHTDISEISPGALPVSLRKVSLSYTGSLRQITNGTFSGLTSLEKITIEGNPKLSVIEAGAFDGRNSSVRDVLLGNNSLTTLSEDLLDWDQVRELDLRGNRWDCSCHIAWMLRTFTREQSEHVVCASPLVLKGKTLASIEESELSCSFIYQHRYEGAIVLSVIVSLAFVAVLAFIGYRFRRHCFAPCMSKGKTYQSLYEVDECDDDEVLSVSFHKNSVSNEKVGMRLAGREANGVAPTAV